MINNFHGKYAFLSNFYPCEVTFEGDVYPTVEHAYQASKTLGNNQRLAIRGCFTPGQAKRMGRWVPLRKDWDKVRYTIMFNLVKQKFDNEPLRSLLIGTFPDDLVERNTWGDRYWGMTYNGNIWIGSNNLGKILMMVRAKIVGIK